MPAFVIDGQDFVALEDLATAFQLTVREESGAITVSSRGRTIVLTRDQPLASVSGRLISMPAPPARVGNRWFVPVDFIGRVLSTVYETRLELRRPSRLVIIGDLRVPRVTVRHEPLGTSARVTVDASPDTRSTIAQEAGRLTIRFEADALDVVMPQIQPIGFVQGIRILDPTALAVDLGPRFGSYRAAQSTAGNTARLVLDLLPAPTETLTLTPTSPAGAPPAATAAPPPLGDLPVFGRQPSPIRTITIDPGHGGDDTGVARRRARKGPHARGRAAAQEHHRSAARPARAADARRRPERCARRADGHCQQQQGQPFHQPARERVASARRQRCLDLCRGVRSRRADADRHAGPAAAVFGGGLRDSSSCPGIWRRPATSHSPRSSRRCSKNSSGSGCGSTRARSSAPGNVCSSRRTCRRCSSRWAISPTPRNRRRSQDRSSRTRSSRRSSRRSSGSATRCRRREANDDGAQRPARCRRGPCRFCGRVGAVRDASWPGRNAWLAGAGPVRADRRGHGGPEDQGEALLCRRRRPDADERRTGRGVRGAARRPGESDRDRAACAGGRAAGVGDSCRHDAAGALHHRAARRTST